jgi:leucyl-tRNA synthetase
MRMAEDQPHRNTMTRTRSLRKHQTKSEGLLWSILRAEQLCGLKFRRQHPIGPWITDFACPTRMLVVEIDGGYHDQTVDQDLRRQHHLQKLGWTIIRFTDDDVEQNAEAVGRGPWAVGRGPWAVGRGIAEELKVPYEFKKRAATGSGSKSMKAAKAKKGKPSPYSISL